MTLDIVPKGFKPSLNLNVPPSSQTSIKIAELIDNFSHEVLSIMAKHQEGSVSLLKSELDLLLESKSLSPSQLSTLEAITKRETKRLQKVKNKKIVSLCTSQNKHFNPVIADVTLNGASLEDTASAHSHTHIGTSNDLNSNPPLDSDVTLSKLNSTNLEDTTSTHSHAHVGTSSASNRNPSLDSDKFYVNLSKNRNITKDEHSVLNLGLSFCPTNNNINTFEILIDLR